MLWFKAWRETKSRVVFALVWALGFLLLFSKAGSGPGPLDADALGMVLWVLALVWLFIPLWLAGSDIRTQAGFAGGATRGLHGSTHYTLSLPVSRARLLLIRAVLGFVETLALLAVLCTAVWVLFPVLRASTTPGEWVLYALTTAVCLFGVYGLAVMVATVADDAVVVPFSTIGLVVLWSLAGSGVLPGPADLFRPMVQSSPLMTDALPWAPMAVAAVIGTAGLAGAVTIANRQQY